MDNLSLKYIPLNKKFICLFSGGKDSGLALSMAAKLSTPVALVHCVEEGHSIYHFQPTELVEAQALHLALPIVFIPSWKKWPSLVKVYREYKSKGVDFVVFGDLRIEDNAKRHIALCASAGLIPCMPLWKRPYDDIAEMMSRFGLKCIISKIESDALDSKWLGKEFNVEAYTHFKSIGIDPMGENGEFHTTMVCSDMYIRPLKYSINVDYDDKYVDFILK